MKKFVTITILLSAIALFIKLSFAQGISTDYPYLYKIESNCRVVYEHATGIFSYNYSILNDTSNKGDIWSIDIDISRNAGSKDLDTVGLSFYKPLVEKWFRDDLRDFRNNIIPVSAAKFPNKRWDACVANNLSISMDLFRPLPKPGEDVSEIELTSKGLPGIRRMVIKPWFDIDLFFLAIDDTSENAPEPFSNEKEDSLRKMVNYYGWTIGPYAPPAIFYPSTFVDDITNMITQSRSLEWIKNQPTADKYLTYFALAKDSLQNKNIPFARATLEQVLVDVDVDSTNNLTSEAYALIRYNTEYLIEHLTDQVIIIALKINWNMVSVPLLQSNYNADVVFPGLFGSAYTCNNATQSYDVTDVVTCGPGYWIYYQDPDTITIGGSVPGPLTITVTQLGWVMLGSRDTPVDLSSLVLTNGARISGSIGYVYSQGTGYMPVSVINPGEGAWVFVVDAAPWPCTITIP